MDIMENVYNVMITVIVVIFLEVVPECYVLNVQQVIKSIQIMIVLLNVKINYVKNVIVNKNAISVLLDHT